MWGFQGGQVSHVFKTSATPMCDPLIKFEQNGSPLCWFWNVVSPYMPWFGVAMAAPFWFPSLWRSPTTLPLCSPWWSPHLEHHQWQPNPFAIRPMSLAVSLFYVVVSPCYTTNVWKASMKVKNSLDILSTTFGLASSHVLGNLSIFYIPKPTCPLFLFSCDSKEESRNAHFHLIQMTSESQCVHATPPLV